MSLVFLQHTMEPESPTKYEFKNWDDALERFSFLKHDDVSPDGVERVSPADEHTRQATRDMRSVINGRELYGTNLPEDIQEGLKYSPIFEAPNGQVYLRGEESMKLGMGLTVQVRSPESPGYAGDFKREVKVREGIAMRQYIDQKVLEIRRTDGKPLSISDINKLPWVDGASVKLGAKFTNEDTGKTRNFEYSVDFGEPDVVKAQFEELAMSIPDDDFHTSLYLDGELYNDYSFKQPYNPSFEEPEVEPEAPSGPRMPF
jgi:hypothetical protein